MTAIHVIEVDHKVMYTHFLDCLYDVLMDEDGVSVAAAGYLEHFLTAEGLRTLFKDGFTMMLLPAEQFNRVEKLNVRNAAFVVRITKDKDTFAWIMSDDCAY
jgi:hypothetical protein